ncbi:MAG: TonB-dependent receptor domain-containing protein [Terriglobales bacterium]
MSRLRSCCLASICLLLVFAAPAFAQFNASIQGTVTDATGAIIPGAVVKVTNQATGVSASSQTTGAGVYRIAGLPPGDYTVTVSAPTFRDQTETNVRVAAETPRGLNVQMIAGGATETVNVSEGSTPDLQTENANVSGTITGQQVVQLPAFGRDPYELLRLAPGVFGDGSRTGAGKGGFLPNNVGVGSSANSLYQVENQPQISANGQRVSANNFTIDGVDVNSLTHGGAAVVTPTEESIQEIKVLSSTYEAEDGRNSGAQVKVISKTGTNSLHGSGFFKYDEPGLNAFNRYTGRPAVPGATPGTCTDGLTTFTRSGTLCPVRVDNKLRNYGGSIGGPIAKDKVFFFFAYEGEHRNNTAFGNNYVYTPQYLNLIKQVAPNSIAAKVTSQPEVQPRIVSVLPSSCADTTAGAGQCAVVSGGLDLGSPNTAGTGPGNPYLSLGAPSFIGSGLDGVPDIQNVEMAYPNPGIGNQYNGRVDWTLSSNHTIAASTYITAGQSTSPPGTDQTSSPSRDVINKPFSPAGTVLWNWVVSPTSLNEVRVNFSHFGFNEINTNPSANYGIPDDEIEGLFKNGRRLWFGVPQGSNTPGLISQNTYGVGDNFSKTFSKHNLKFGFDYRKEQNNNNQVGFARPLFSTVRLWNFVNDAPIFEQNEINPVNGAASASFRHFRTNYVGGFGQDDWKASPTLTLNFGLRYEYYSPVSEANGLLSNLVLAGNGPDAIANARLITGSTVYSVDKKNFAPRFGFAWSPNKYKQTVVFRGGFGMYYDYIPEAAFDPARDNPPFSSLQGNCCGTDSSPFDAGKILYALGASNSPLSYPANPVLGGGIDPTTNFPRNGTAQVYFTPQNMHIPYVYGYSLDTEMQMPAQVVVTVGYQGSDSHDLLRIFNANQVFDTPSQHSNPSFYIKPDVDANYNSLNVRAVRNFANNFQVAMKYRWSKSLDTVSFGDGANASANETYPRNLRTEYGPSDYDTTNFLLISAVARSPYVGGRSSLVGKIVGGWEFSPIYTFHTGFPWTPVSNNCINTPGQVGICPIRPIAYLGGAGMSTDNSALITGANFPGGGLNFFNPGPNNCTPATCAPGVGRNSFRGPNYESLDLAFGKTFPLSFVRESADLQLRMNAFNVFNHLNLAPYGFNTPSTIIQDPNFGTPGTTTALAGRVIELQARFQF